MLTLIFWKAVAERAIKTFGQVLGVLITVEGLSVTGVDWPHVLGVAALCGIASVATSVGGAAVTNGTPSLNDAETLRKG